MNNYWTDYGRRRFADAIAKDEPLEDVGNELARQLASSAGKDAFGGFVSAGLETLDKLRAAGFKFSGDQILTQTGQAASLELIGIFERQEWATLNNKISMLISVLEGCRRWLFVQQVPAVSAPPLAVHIVAMPDRVTETQIERNDTGEIVASLQVERDAA